MNIHKIEKFLKEEIRKEHTYNGKRWRRSLSNQPGVYDVKLNVQQIMILHEAIQHKRGRKDTVLGMPYPVHLKRKWNTMAIEIMRDYSERMEKREEIDRESERNFIAGRHRDVDGQWSAEICESNLNKIKEGGKTT